MGTRFSGKDLKVPFPKGLNVLLHQATPSLFELSLRNRSKTMKPLQYLEPRRGPPRSRMLHLHISIGTLAVGLSMPFLDEPR